MEVTVAATVWALFACFLLFPMLGLSLALQRTAGTLLAAEIVAFGVWHFGSQGCIERPCAPLAEAGRSAAGLDLPVLTVALIALVIMRGMRARKLGG